MSNVRIIFIFALVLKLASSQSLPEDDGENGEYFEGDLIITDDQKQMLFNKYSRVGIRSEYYRWPKAKVFYTISKSFSGVQKEHIEASMKTIESVSCVRFKKRRNERDYVHIQSDEPGCFSNAGRIGGEQTLNLGEKCFYRKAIVLHELLHTLGFYHEQSAYDRDNIVKIHEDRIIKGHEHNFRKYTNEKVSYFGSSYDYDSVMHYSAFAFSKNKKKPTIESLDPKLLHKIGQREKLSEQNIYRINSMYNCK